MGMATEDQVNILVYIGAEQFRPVGQQNGKTIILSMELSNLVFITVLESPNR